MKSRNLFLVCILIMGISAAAYAQGQGMQHQSGKATQDCQAMMREHQQMMQDMQQKDHALQKKLQSMNSAKGDQKVQAMADIINDLVKQRQEMLQRMSQMQMDMMSHMANHMSSAQGMQSMANCPMMQGNMQQKQNPPMQHDQHHPAQ